MKNKLSFGKYIWLTVPTPPPPPLPLPYPPEKPRSLPPSPVHTSVVVCHTRCQTAECWKSGAGLSEEHRYANKEEKHTIESLTGKSRTRSQYDLIGHERNSAYR